MQIKKHTAKSAATRSERELRFFSSHKEILSDESHYHGEPYTKIRITENPYTEIRITEDLYTEIRITENPYTEIRITEDPYTKIRITEDPYTKIRFTEVISTAVSGFSDEDRFLQFLPSWLLPSESVSFFLHTVLRTMSPIGEKE